MIVEARVANPQEMFVVRLPLNGIFRQGVLVGRLLSSVIEGVLIAVVVAVGMTSSLGVGIPLQVLGLLPAVLTIIDIIILSALPC